MIRKLAVFCLCLGLLSSPGAAASGGRSIDLAEGADITLIGGSRQVQEGGDVNGDGIPDLLLHTGSVGSQGPSNGRVYVVFGDPDRSELRVDELGTQGFIIHGAKPEDFASVARAAGDVNGDGLDDIIVGAPGASAESIGSLRAGAAYIVFGKVDPAPVHLALFDAGLQGPLGFKIEGSSSWSLTGEHVAGAGDVNSDGLDDVVVGAPWGGATYVVFGKKDFASVPLSRFHRTPGGRGFLIRTPTPEAAQWYNVAGFGDVNGDGVPDVGIAYANRKVGWNYIVFGKADDREVDVLRKGGWGFRIKHGGRVWRIGDVNGDGLADIMSGMTVVFGHRRDSDMNIDNLTGRGFYIAPVFMDRGVDGSGTSIAPAGDLDGDGLEDFVLGAGLTDFRGREYAGVTYVLLGKKDGRTIDLAKAGRFGYRIGGSKPKEQTGASALTIADMNGDGLREFVIGGGTNDAPKVYIVFGRP